jgi:hypothetical protein
MVWRLACERGGEAWLPLKPEVGVPSPTPWPTLNSINHGNARLQQNQRQLIDPQLSACLCIGPLQTQGMGHFGVSISVYSQDGAIIRG